MKMLLALFLAGAAFATLFPLNVYSLFAVSTVGGLFNWWWCRR